MMLNEFEVPCFKVHPDIARSSSPVIGGLLRSGFDAGIGRETVVQMGGGNPELKTELQGNGWRKGKKMLIPPAGEDDRTISG